MEGAVITYFDVHDHDERVVAIRELVEDALDEVVADLGIKRPKARFFEHAGEHEAKRLRALLNFWSPQKDLAALKAENRIIERDVHIRGLADHELNEIFIRIDQDSGAIVETIAHECKHVARLRTFDRDLSDEELKHDEGVAYAYGQRFWMAWKRRQTGTKSGVRLNYANWWS